jgi:hypothetical protein
VFSLRHGSEMPLNGIARFCSRRFYPQRLAGTVIRQDPQLGTLWLVAVQVAGVAASTVIGPILWISATVFYFNLRIRKEALDLQWMMNPENVSRPILS